MDVRTFKDAVYGHLARLGRALAAPKRISPRGTRWRDRTAAVRGTGIRASR